MTPAKQDQPERTNLYQQLHRGCGGELCIVATADRREIWVVCKSCKTQWRILTPAGFHEVLMPSDWESYTPGAEPEPPR